VSETLGRVERPAAESFIARRKLYLVFLVFTHESAPQEYKDRCDKYWRQVGEQLANLESKAGAATHVYHESVSEQGEAGLALLKRLHRFSHELVQTRCANGAVLEAMEDAELVAEVSDWERFMMMGYSSSKVGELVRDLYTQALKKRNGHVLSVIDTTLGPGESGLLLVGEGHRLQFPSDIEVFSVVPPALDELHRWLRDQAAQRSEKDETSDASAAAPDAAPEDEPEPVDVRNGEES
jgi:hypothetical protein